MRRHENAPLSPKGRELNSSRRSWWRPAQAAVALTFGTRSMPRFLGRFLPWPTVSRWPLSLQDDAQVELGYEFSFAAQLPARQYPLNRAIMPFMSVIFEGLRGDGTCFLAVWSPPNELVSAAPTKRKAQHPTGAGIEPCANPMSVD